MGLAPETNYLRDVQYRTPVNLNARMAVHILFSTNEYGWPRWLFDRFDLPEDSDVLEIGCGPGTVWAWEPTKAGFMLVGITPGYTDQ